MTDDEPTGEDRDGDGRAEGAAVTRRVRTAVQRRVRVGGHRGEPRALTVPRTVVAALLGLAGFTVVLVLVAIRWAPLDDLDRAVATDLAAAYGRDSGWAGLLTFVHHATQPWVLRAVGVIVAGILLTLGRRRLGTWVLVTVALGTVLEPLLKRAVGRERPALAEPVVHLGGSGFPSGHALTSALVIGALLVVLRELGAGRRLRIAAWSVGVLVVLLVGWDRVALAVHYVSDVIGGWLLAVGLLGATLAAFGSLDDRSRAGADRRGVPRRRVAVILNPAKIEGVAAFRQQLERQATEAGWDAPLWLETTRDDPGQGMVREALDAESDLVIAAGGDGTVRVVCAGLAGTGVPVGIVPVGTGNLLVRNLGLPLDRTAAIRVALTGTDRALDLVSVEGDALSADRFAVMAGLGLDAAVVGEAPAKLKRTMGWPAYAVSMVRNLSFPAIRVEITVDDEPTVRRWVRTVLIGNVGTLHGGLSLLPDAQPDDGMLDVVAVAPRSLTDWPGVAWRVARRSAAQDDRLRTWRGKRVVVRAMKACPRQLDGDVIEVGHELRCEIEPGVLLMRVPRHFTP